MTSRFSDQPINGVADLHYKAIPVTRMTLTIDQAIKTPVAILYPIWGMKSPKDKQPAQKNDIAIKSPPPLG